MRRPSRRVPVTLRRLPRALALATCLALVLAASVPVEESVDRLADYVDPARDDWPGEAFRVRAAGQLRRLADRLERGTADPGELAVERARTTPLRPNGLARLERAGPVRIARGDGSGRRGATLERALAELLRPFGPSGPRRVAFEIVEVDLRRHGSATTRVCYEAWGANGDVLQQTARWRVSWRDAAGPAPRIAGIRLETYEEAAREKPGFEDCTGAVLPPDSPAARDLQWGSESWHGRVDAVAGPSLLGHHGVAVGDVDGDGLEDLYVATGNGLPNRLLVQDPRGRLEDHALEAGVAWLDDTGGVLFADMDNDGDQDLLLAIGPSILVCHNDGSGRFDRFSAVRAATPAGFRSLSVADYDLDGDLDVYGARYAPIGLGSHVPWPLHDASNGPTNHLLRNDGERGLVDVTREVGLHLDNGRFSQIGAWGDFDDDGDLDLYVVNDFGPNNLYRNDEGKFVDVAARARVEDPAAGRSASWVDYDLDGDLDLHVTNTFSAAGLRMTGQPGFARGAGRQARRRFRRLAEGDTLLANQGDGTFREVGAAAGLRMGRWGWGSRFVDMNNDGFDDVVVPNGFLSGQGPHDLDSFYWRRVASRAAAADGSASAGTEPYQRGWEALGRLLVAGASWSGRQRHRAYLNLGDGRFADVSHASGLDLADDGRAAAAIDWDEDGDEDLWMRNRSGPQLRLMRNDGGAAGHWITLRLEGVTSNRDAVGATVELHVRGRRLRRVVGVGDGYLAQSSRWLHFGLGEADRIERVMIRWPGGGSESLPGPPVDARYRIRQGAGGLEAAPARALRLATRPALTTTAPPPASILLKEPLALPPRLRELLFADGVAGRAKLLQLWEPGCEPCVDGLTSLARRYPDLRAGGVDVLALNVDAVADRETATRVFAERVAGHAAGSCFVSRAASARTVDLVAALVEHVTRRPAKVSLPMGLLVDGQGLLQLIYLGPVGVEEVIGDHTRWVARPVVGAERSLRAGRWYYRNRRDLMGLASDLKRRGLREEARFYVGIAGLRDLGRP